MSKVMRTVSIESEVNERLKIENNASGLVEGLLKQYFDLKILKESQINVKELDAKAKELNLKLEEIEIKKKEALSEDEIKARLNKIGITNLFLIERLKKMENKENFLAIKSLKEQYRIKEILSLYEAWNILHGEVIKNEDNPQT